MKMDRKWILSSIVVCSVLALAYPLYAALGGKEKVELRSAEWTICEKAMEMGSGDLVLIPNPKNCRAYFECDNGIPVPMECPRGFYYCLEEEICTWIIDYRCSFPCDLLPEWE